MQVKKQRGNNGLVSNWERNTSRLYIVTLLIKLIYRVHRVKCWAGCSTSWNQDCWKKYQQPQICRWHHPYGRKRGGTEVSSVDESEREEWKSWLKTQHSTTKIRASGPITLWQIYRVKLETVTDFILLGSKITADDDCSHEIKRCLLFGIKAMTHLDSILKSRDITLLTKVRIVKAMVFPIVIYGCEGWTIKKAEHWRIDTFELWCWRRLLRVPWTARRSTQSILK